MLNEVVCAFSRHGLKLVGDEAELHDVAEDHGEKKSDRGPSDLAAALHQGLAQDDDYIESQRDEQAIQNEDVRVSRSRSDHALNMKGRKQRANGIDQQEHDELKNSGQ